MTKMVKLFANDESGATAIEYALIAAIMGVGIVAGLRTLQTSVDGALTGVAGDIDTGASTS